MKNRSAHQAGPPLRWTKSSYSSEEGGECVEVAVAWRTSSYSSGAGGECVEVAARPGTVHVRDSKDKEGPILNFEAAAWGEFIQFASTQLQH